MRAIGFGLEQGFKQTRGTQIEDGEALAWAKLPRAQAI